ncbi:Bor/Iss family lipoprotein [Candidatus Palauibacter sp.]|uniref:Bor/Iss family lipoprotein n=1 Tax=Candidatus Palauibacter sp. TaxID=3101350 RepID=UPI003B52F068
MPARGCGEGGVAWVETRISVLNQLVSALTLGIYSPMEIVVTCGSAEETDGTQPQPEVPESRGSTPGVPKGRSDSSG